MTWDPASFHPKNFEWKYEGCIATVTLNRPELKNALTFETYDELRDIFWQLKHTRLVRVVVLRGAGGNFCSGGINEEILGPLTKMDEAGLRRFTRMTGDLVRAMRSCPQPIIAAIEGLCAGAGAVLAMASDIRLAQQGCVTAFHFTRAGLSGAHMGAAALLPRLIGPGRAAELLFTGRDMTTDEGLAWGFYNRVVQDVLAESYALAAELSRGPRIAHALTKRQLDAEWNVSLDEALETEARVQAHCMQTGDFKRAYEAFRRNEEPDFKGD